MSKTQYYGIAFPFKTESDENSFFDSNKTQKDKARSVITHLILTPKGQKIRDPEFGTNLIKFIFAPDDNTTFTEVKNECVECVHKYLSNVTITNIEVESFDTNTVYVKVDYSVNDGITSNNDTFIVKI